MVKSMRVLFSSDTAPELRAALESVFEETGITVGAGGRQLLLEKREKGLSVRVEEQKITIAYTRRCELFRGIGLAKEHFDEPGFFIEEFPAYKTLGLLADNSRNAVNTVETMKKAIRVTALMGFNVYMPYMEDVYEVPEYPYFGYMRGRYTKEEMQELDRYAQQFGIELIPAIQTLAHVNAIFHWPAFQGVRDLDDILLVGEEETYRLLDRMLASISEMFSSRRINIGMDEAFSLGRGRYFDINGKRPKSEIMLLHLTRMLELCDKYGLKPMMWSDMFTRNGDSVVDELPNGLSDRIGLIHWDYCTGKTEYAVEAFQQHKKLAPHVVFAGGAWKWEGYAPFLEYSYMTTRNALEAVRQCGIDEVIVTAWSDAGGEASLFSVLPVYQMFAEACYENNMTDGHVAKRLQACADACMADFTALELPNLPVPGEMGGGYATNPARYLLFQDVLMGLYDRHVIEDAFAEHFASLVPRYEEAIRRNPKWSYIFELMLAMSRLLASKVDIGIKLKKAYDAGDRTQLAVLLERLRELRGLCVDFHRSVRTQWLTENKAFGLDVQDIRLGGVTARVDTAIMRVEDYLSGRTDRLEELEPDRLYADGRPADSTDSPNTHVWHWREIVSAGVVER